MKEIAITLPMCKLSCRRCGYTWKEAVPRWDRGHVLMERENQRVFLFDDIVLELGEAVDFASLLMPIGFSWLGSRCRDCGSDRVRVIRGLLVAYDACGEQEMKCLELTVEDFVKDGTRWHLNPLTVRDLRK
jgi:hypothetical protein